MKRLLLDESMGIYIPNRFYENFDLAFWGLNPDDYKDLANYESDTYWDTWQELLDEAKHTDKNGYIWHLWQDGALFAVKKGSNYMETYLQTQIETNNLDENTTVKLRPMSLNRALDQVKKAVPYSDRSTLAAWSDYIIEKAEEKYAMNGGLVEVEIAPRFTKSRELEYIVFDDKDFILGVF